ncbi:MAG: PAP fibrillin [Cyanobacteria bacterium]|nr:PAP fibrillin [Cyanobacteriota bacterium]
MSTLPSGSESTRIQLLKQLGPPGPGRSAAGASERVRGLIEQLELEQPADLVRDQALLRGVWELRWSSSSLPYLAVAPWLENLQLLDPDRGLGMNLLRLSGPLGSLAGIAVQAAIGLEPAAAGASEPARPVQRVSVRFLRGGWLGPQFGSGRLKLLREVKQGFPAWLDITVLDQQLRVCHGSAGTLFVLLRRPDLSLESLMG